MTGVCTGSWFVSTHEIASGPLTSALPTFSSAPCIETASFYTYTDNEVRHTGKGRRCDRKDKTSDHRHTLSRNSPAGSGGYHGREAGRLFNRCWILILIRTRMETATYKAVLLGGNGLDRTGTYGYCQARKGKVKQAKQHRGGRGSSAIHFRVQPPFRFASTHFLYLYPLLSEHICVGS
jgi:hypothetical protein